MRRNPPRGTTGVPTPRYAGVEETLRGRIAAGSYILGDSLPSETQLANEFEVSRFTVREALRRMGEAGLIDRRQGARARVIGRTPGTSYTVSVGSAEDLQAYANATYFEIEQVARFEVTAPLSRFLRSRTRKEWLVLSGNRKDAKTGDTVGYTEVYLWAEFEPYLPKITSRGSPIHQQIDDNLGIRAISIFQEIAAVPMPAVAASALRREPGSPALEIVRRYFGTRGRAFEVARNLHAAESFTFTQEFQRHEIVGEI